MCARPRIDMPLLEVTNLRTSFHTRNGVVRAVNDVSFSLEKGETLGIVGESGSGKSVTCYSLMRLDPAAAGPDRRRHRDVRRRRSAALLARSS